MSRKVDGLAIERRSSEQPADVIGRHRSHPRQRVHAGRGARRRHLRDHIEQITLSYPDPDVFVCAPEIPGIPVRSLSHLGRNRARAPW